RAAREPLDERPSSVTGRTAVRRARSLEDEDLAALRAAEVVGEPVHEQAVARRGETDRARAGAMKRRLHRGGWDSIGLRDLRLENQHESDRQGERDEPVGDFPPWIG